MNDQKNNGLNLDITPDIAEGTYSNLAIITHSPAEFVIDFAQTLPGTKNPTVRSRVILAPMHAKRLLAALAENVNRYEKQFGPIQEPTDTKSDGTVPYDILGKA